MSKRNQVSRWIFWSWVEQASHIRYMKGLLWYSIKWFSCALVISHQSSLILFNSFYTAPAKIITFGTILSGRRNFFWGPNSKIWHAEKIELEKSFPTNPNMTYFSYFAFAKAEIIAFEVGTSGKRKKSTFSIFAVQKELTSLKMTLKARLRLWIGSFYCSDDISGSFKTKGVIHHRH